uniref:Uncharacterized protein n=1 Tax=Aegilops tauschii subsp. strangulata TaxID=200361 RepID=A0A453HCW3_AEGTS
RHHRRPHLLRRNPSDGVPRRSLPLLPRRRPRSHRFHCPARTRGPHSRRPSPSHPCLGALLPSRRRKVVGTKCLPDTPEIGDVM